MWHDLPCWIFRSHGLITWLQVLNHDLLFSVPCCFLLDRLIKETTCNVMLQSHVTPWRQYTSHVKVWGTLPKMDVSALVSPDWPAFELCYIRYDVCDWKINFIHLEAENNLIYFPCHHDRGWMEIPTEAFDCTHNLPNRFCCTHILILTYKLSWKFRQVKPAISQNWTCALLKTYPE